MICNKCGAIVEKNIGFCPACGTELSADGPSQAASRSVSEGAGPIIPAARQSHTGWIVGCAVLFSIVCLGAYFIVAPPDHVAASTAAPPSVPSVGETVVPPAVSPNALLPAPLPAPASAQEVSPVSEDADSLDALGTSRLADNDRAGALEFFRKASRLQNTHSMVMIGVMTSEDGNYSNAAEMFQEASDLGNPRGMYNLGVLYETGKGVTYSLEDAAHWYGLAEKLGDASATYRLGTMYEQGAGGMPRDLQKAKDLYQRAGIPEAMKRLAMISPQVP